MSNAISFKGVSKVFPGGTHALRDIHFEVNEGEFMVVVGPSGCGKSTLLRLIAGLESQSSGQIDLFGKNADNLPPQQRDLGMVFQNYALFPHLSVFDNIAYGLKIRRESGPEIRQKVDSVARKLDILELLKRKPHQLSGGQRQRVALGRLLARNPKIHLFDEPLGNLDPQFRSVLRTELFELHRESSRTTVYVTHDQAEAMTLGQRICVLRKGQVLQTGSPDEIYNQPAHRFVAEFFGSPGAQCIDGRIDKNGENSFLFVTTGLQFELEHPLLLPAGSITLGIRPEDWQISSPENSQIQAVIKRIENLGDHRLIEVQSGGNKIIVKTSSTGFYENESIGLNLPTDTVHWFERYTGKRIQAS
jgi:ABC-type sugar transport system ATPase subunit